jgi:hypothetical protein
VEDAVVVPEEPELVIVKGGIPRDDLVGEVKFCRSRYLTESAGVTIVEVHVLVGAEKQDLLAAAVEREGVGSTAREAQAGRRNGACHRL